MFHGVGAKSTRKPDTAKNERPVRPWGPPGRVPWSLGQEPLGDDHDLAVRLFHGATAGRRARVFLPGQGIAFDAVDLQGAGKRPVSVQQIVLVPGVVGGTEHNVEITSMADIPAGTGLGSSGSFGTALLKALYRFRNRTITPG